MINVSYLVIQSALLEISVWLGMDQPSAKAGWRCATTIHGGQCVVIHGASMKPLLYASSSDIMVSYLFIVPPCITTVFFCTHNLKAHHMPILMATLVWELDLFFLLA